MLQQQLDELDTTKDNNNVMAVTEELEHQNWQDFTKGGHNNIISRYHCVKKLIMIKHSVFGSLDLANPHKFY